MKILQLLRVNYRTIPIVSFSLVLDGAGPGRGVFVVRETGALEGGVSFYAGLDPMSVERYFTGSIERCEKIDSKQRRLLVRETGAALDKRLPIAMRTCPLKAVIAEIAGKSGIAFRTSGKWSERSVSHFVNTGSGHAALKLIGDVSGVADFVAVGNADGSIYLGPSSMLKRRKKILALNDRIFTQMSAAGADLPFMPALRPLMRIRIGDGDVREIASIEVSGEKMRVRFS